MMKTKNLVDSNLGLANDLCCRDLARGSGRNLASSHREAPITALDPMADITDLWAFRSYDSSGNDTSPAEHYDDHGGQSLRGAGEWSQLVPFRSPDPL